MMTQLSKQESLVQQLPCQQQPFINEIMTGTTSIGMLYNLKDMYSVLLNIQRAVFQIYSGQGGPTCITTIDYHWKMTRQGRKMQSFVMATMGFIHFSEFYKGYLQTCNPLWSTVRLSILKPDNAPPLPYQEDTLYFTHGM